MLISLYTVRVVLNTLGAAGGGRGGLSPPIVSEIVKGIPREEFEAVNWTQKPDREVFCAD
jgi:hypothetical protein